MGGAHCQCASTSGADVWKNKKGKDKGPMRWSRVVLSIFVFSCLFFPVSILTAPIAISICLYQLVKPSQKLIILVSRLPYIGYALVGVLQLWAWFAFFGKALIFFP